MGKDSTETSGTYQPVGNSSPITTPRRSTGRVEVGGVGIGGDSAISVQTMWKSPLSEGPGPDKARIATVDTLIAAITRLQGLGCDIIRFAVPDEPSAAVISELASRSPIPIVADIHFDFRLALACIRGGVHKIRINPGNIGTPWKAEEVIRAAKDHDTPLRVGVNGGSLPASMRGMPLPEAMVAAAESELELTEKHDLRNVIVSLKASDMEATIEANRIFSGTHDYPLHLGLTEAGPPIQGIVRSTLVLGRLLEAGIGDTVRVSLSGSAENEVSAAVELLKSLRLRQKGVSVISCPRCGRATFDVHGFLEKHGTAIYSVDKELTVAVMGCAVNGPEEAKRADLGITGTGTRVLIFRDGTVLRDVEPSEAGEAFIQELEKA